jgi:hypothetical protein
MVDIKREPLDLPALQRELLDFERIYGVSSAALSERFSAKDIDRDPGLQRWSFLFAVLRRLGRVPARAA